MTPPATAFARRDRLTVRDCDDGGFALSHDGAEDEMLSAGELPASGAGARPRA
jgi:hypothetical protein